jgi:hypothetical protein
MARGMLEQASNLLQASLGATIPWLSGTMQEWLASVSRKLCHAAERLEGLESGMHPIVCTSYTQMIERSHS